MVLLFRGKRFMPNLRKAMIQVTETYGVVPPRLTPEKAKEIDHVNGNNLWGDAMLMEAQSQIDHNTYKFLEPGVEVLKGYQEICLRIIFDIKQDQCRIARTIASGHMVDALISTATPQT